MELPGFTKYGVLPVGDYELTIGDLRESHLVSGTGSFSSNWDSRWRAHLVDNLEVLVMQLRHVGIDRIFVDGSFVEDKEHPNDIDGYFECDVRYFVTGQLERDLNALDPHRVWTWDPRSRRPHRDTTKRQLPMWHLYHVELYPHFPGLLTGTTDRYGNDLEFPAAFRRSRTDDRPKGIIRLLRA